MSTLRALRIFSEGERIVHVVLKPDEGGLNLTMTDATVQKLVDYGKKAGQLLRDSFVLEEHRWRRFLHCC